MPTYEYRCNKCGEHIEVVQSFHDDALTECALCGGELKKVFHPVGIVFRGSGFYVTDSKSPTSTASSAGDSARGERGERGEKATKSESSDAPKKSESSDAPKDGSKPDSASSGSAKTA